MPFPRVVLSSTTLWLSETAALINGGGDDTACAHNFASELGRVGAVWEASVVPSSRPPSGTRLRAMYRVVPQPCS